MQGIKELVRHLDRDTGGELDAANYSAAFTLGRTKSSRF